jgi:hypothetical protein
MAQWEYTQERIERPLGSEGRGVTPEAMKEINQFGADGWEVCSILADRQAWIVLLKREIPGLGMGAPGAREAPGAPHRTHPHEHVSPRPDGLRVDKSRDGCLRTAGPPRSRQ